MEDLPYELALKILNDRNLRIKDIIALCNTNSVFKGLCNDHDFWSEVMRRKLNPVLFSLYELMPYTTNPITRVVAFILTLSVKTPIYGIEVIESANTNYILNGPDFESKGYKITKKQRESEKSDFYATHKIKVTAFIWVYINQSDFASALALLLDKGFKYYYVELIRNKWFIRKKRIEPGFLACSICSSTATATCEHCNAAYCGQECQRKDH